MVNKFAEENIMTKKDLQKKEEIIQDTFGDNRTVNYLSSNELEKINFKDVEKDDFLKTDNDELIYLHFQLSDFGIDELNYYVDLAEYLYNLFNMKVNLYLICTKYVKVTIKESIIRSEAYFTIKLACIDEDPVEIVHRAIKKKIANNETLNDDDLHALSMMPVMCRIEDRSYYRKEYFRLMNKIM